MSYAFRFLDDIAIADIAFEAEGDSAEELFVGATKALLEVLANPVTIADTWQRQVLKREGNLDDLLIEWLSEIVYWKDAAGVVFRDAPLTLRGENGDWTIKATLIGAPVDAERQERDHEASVQDGTQRCDVESHSGRRCLRMVRCG
jgi:SHS2 domain-containing protein